MAMNGKGRNSRPANRRQKCVDLCVGRLDPGSGPLGNARAGANQIDRLDRLYQEIGRPPLQQRARDVLIECLRDRYDRRPGANARHQLGKRGHLVGTSGVKINDRYGCVRYIEGIAMLGEATRNKSQFDRGGRTKSRAHRILEFGVRSKNHHAGAVRVRGASDAHDGFELPIISPVPLAASRRDRPARHCSANSRLARPDRQRTCRSPCGVMTRLVR